MVDFNKSINLGILFIVIVGVFGVVAFMLGSVGGTMDNGSIEYNATYNMTLNKVLEPIQKSLNPIGFLFGGLVLVGVFILLKKIT